MRASRRFLPLPAPAWAAGFFLAVGLFASVGIGPVQAQQGERASREGDTLVFRVRALEVTATRTARPVFTTPAPVSVLPGLLLQQRGANTITDLFRDLPGLDVTGVGVQQPRPVIRGQRGQRILLLQDGIRLNNTRRQQDFGEVPAIVDPNSVARVEVVRGPASVLYGTDAIGGVVNVITRGAPTVDGIHGWAGYRYGSAGDMRRGSGTILGRKGRLDFTASGSLREAGGYEAPAGTFGGIELSSPTAVLNTGIEDSSFDLRVGFSPSENHRLFVKGERYVADSAGFGLVEPDAYSPGLARIAITYPTQRFQKVTAGYAGQGFDLAFLDRLDVTGYAQDNERELSFDLFQSFGPQAPPGAGLTIASRNFTDLSTAGFRVEAKKLAGPVLFTYGADFFRDKSENTDSSLTLVVGFGPPQSEVSTRPQVPAASYRSLGAFLQGEFVVGDLTLIAGGRIQGVRASTRATPGFDGLPVSESDRALVGAVNGIYQLGDRVSVIGSVGRAFRAPNLIEWFFEGPVPEAGAYQITNPELKAETSLNVDGGVRFQDRNVSAEAFVFRNRIADGIRTQPTGEEINGLDGFFNVNVDELVYRGIELSAAAAVVSGVTVTGSWTHITSEDIRRPDNPVGESFTDKVTGAVRYDDPRGRFWGAYSIRHNGEQTEVFLDVNPLGDVLPAFTVQAVRMGTRLFRGERYEQRLTLAIENLTDQLYAESSNASFFRPESRRNVALGLQWVF